jgi:hypothetical protein
MATLVSTATGSRGIQSTGAPFAALGFDDATYRGDAYPAFGWAACVASVDVDLDTGEVHVRDVLAVDARLACRGVPRFHTLGDLLPGDRIDGKRQKDRCNHFARTNGRIVSMVPAAIATTNARAGDRTMNQNG